MKSLLPAITLLAALLFAAACASSSLPPPDRNTTQYGVYRSINLQPQLIRYGTNGRFSGRGMNPRYITVHSTANLDATAQNHADALSNGKLRTSRSGLNRTGFLTWHFSVDDISTFQHLPTDEQGEHADYSGPGNRYSVGVEICEFRDWRRQQAAVDRSARLVAYLMYTQDIPLRRVVPHYHWPRYPNNWHKPCPRIFMTRGKPGRKWKDYKDRVNLYYKQLKSEPRPEEVVPAAKLLPQIASLQTED